MAKIPIGITAPVSGDELAYKALAIAVGIAGGHPVKITTGMSWRETDVCGLVIGGGDDVFPAHYGKTAIEGARYDQGRDEMEMYWARTARDEDIPTLAICRGAQIMNVAGGGTLHQELTRVYENVDYPSTRLGQVFYRKDIEITDGSLLRDIIGKQEIGVNSIHKQAIDLTGENLVVTAREHNGVVQAIEDPRREFYLGVQFHPEFLIHRAKFRRLFNRLVLSAGDCELAYA